MIDLEWIRERVRSNNYKYSLHGDKEREADNLLFDEVEQALTTGRILEQYEDTGRGESCLMVGFTNEGKPIHVVCGERNNLMIIVTTYIPSPPKFKTPYERG
ncbi:MAG: DUF4258 domain-containing protein [Ignavibacteriae bacterium]|nr:DUF4258 domain-containing protein [Ignavibacteriota bacterium]